MNDETMIQEAAGRLFADNADSKLNERVADGNFPTELWSQVQAAGFHLALVRSDKGFDLEPSQALPILEELGKHRLPLPLAETAVALALLDAGQLELPDGPGTLIDSGITNTLNLDRTGRIPTINGIAKSITWGRHAHWAVAKTANSEELLFVRLIDSDRVAVESKNDIAGLPADTLVFAGAPVKLLRMPESCLADPLRSLSALAYSNMMVGAMQWVLEQTIQYANDRIQFGKPIGKNQALQQLLARAAGDVASARMAARAASIDLTGESEDSRRSMFGIAVAKIRCSEAASHVSSVAHQVMGAIGFTHEHALHYATRRLWTWRDSYGSDSWWAQRLGEIALRSGADSFWSAMTLRQFPQLK